MAEQQLLIFMPGRYTQQSGLCKLCKQFCIYSRNFAWIGPVFVICFSR